MSWKIDCHDLTISDQSIGIRRRSSVAVSLRQSSTTSVQVFEKCTLCCVNLIYLLINYVFTARCYASTVLAMGLCPSLSVCLCLSQVGVLLKRLIVGSHNQHHTIAQGL